jgi:hypothetical protein
MAEKIARHKVDTQHLTNFYFEDLERMSVRIEMARRSSDVLTSLASIAEGVYMTGSVVAPDDAQTGFAIRVAAQANTATLVFAHIEAPPRYCPLGDGPPVTYDVPTDESHVHGGRWVQAFRQAVVSRQPDLLGHLKTIPGELLRLSSTRGDQISNDWDEFHRAILTDRLFTRHPAFVSVTEWAARAQQRSRDGKAVILLTVPYLDVLRSMEQLDEAKFSVALAEALRMHKKYWGGTEERRRDLNGLVSLKLTAAAALAWDRGLRFDVESDYMPRSWVTGELFRQSPGPGPGPSC